LRWPRSSIWFQQGAAPSRRSAACLHKILRAGYLILSRTRFPGWTRILVLDPNAAAREAARSALESAGHAAVSADTADRALALLQTQSFELLVGDLLAPGLTSARFVEWLRRHPGLRVVLANRPAPAPLLEEALALPVRAVVGKPYRPAALRAAVERI
jgi:CheY-like chemotaxis protein